jgi:acetolactate synthase-1/2/3 large subunit/5-guanidino-2-oxopentanoate decarboxylase
MKDQLAAAATVCDWSELAQSDAQVYRLIDQAFAEFAHQRPRPKHIQIPITSLAAPAAQPLPRAPAPVAGDIAKAAEMLRLAKKPLVILGGARARGFRDAVIAAAGCCKLYHLRRAGGG